MSQVIVPPEEEKKRRPRPKKSVILDTDLNPSSDYLIDVSQATNLNLEYENLLRAMIKGVTQIEDDDQINELLVNLLNVVYTETQTFIITNESKSIINEIVSLLYSKGYDITLEYLSNIPNNFRNSLIFESPTLLEAQNTLLINTEITKNKVVPSKYGFKCKFCKELSVLHSEKQTRAADEPATQFFHCTACDKHWRS